MNSRLLLLLIPTLASAATQSPFANIWFEPNRGQAPQAAEFVARIPGATLAFGAGGVRVGAGAQALVLRFTGAQRAARFEPLDPTPDRSGYFLGSDPAAWTRDVPHYRRLAWRGVYPGIDVIFYGSEGRLEYDLVVSPGADPARIRLRFQSGAAPEINAAGDLFAGPLRMHRPRVYQPGGEEIDARYRLHGAREVRFRLGAYDRTRPMTIDPILQLMTYYGGERDDSVVALTSMGDVVGVTSSSGFSEGTRRTGKDIFALITLSNGGQFLAFFGGSDDDVPTCAIAGSRSLVIGGWTRSSDFQNKPAFGGTDGFILEYDRGSGTFGLPALTRIGGSGDDRILALAGAGGIQYTFAGDTTSPDLTLNGQPLTTQYAGGTDVLFGSLAFGTLYQLSYYGGSGDESAYAVTYEGNRLTIAGKTTSPDLPLKDALSGQLSGPSDAFLARFDNLALNQSTTFALNFATYFGGSGDDEIRALAYNGTGALFLTFAGTTSSTDLPVAQAMQPKYGGGPSDAFLGRLLLATHEIAYTTYVGGSGRDEAAAVVLNTLGDDVAAGTTTSPDLAVAGAFQDHLNGPQDAWYCMLTGGALQSLSYFGGSGSDSALALAVSADSVITLAGSTDSTDLPSPAVDSRPSVPGGGQDGFVAQLALARFVPYNGKTVWTGKDLGTYLAFYLSSAAALNSHLTVTSTDPSRVLVSLGYGITPSAGFTLPLSTISPNQGSFNIVVVGAAESGEADVSVALDGFPAQTYHVRLGAVVVQPFSPSFVAAYYLDQFPNFYPTPGVLDDAGHFVGGFLMNNAAPFTVNYSVSSPSTATLSAPSSSLPSLYTPAIRLTSTASGPVDVAATCSGCMLTTSTTATYKFVDAKLLPATDIPLGKDLQRSVLVPYDHYMTSNLVNISTDSPDKLCFPLDSGDCVAARDFQGFTNFQIRGLSDSGSATVRYNSDKSGQSSFTVQLTQPKLSFSQFPPSGPRTVPAASNSAVQVFFGSALDTTTFTAQPRPGFTPVITVTSSDPSVVAIGTASTGYTFNFSALKPGRATLVASAPGFATSDPIDIVVTAIAAQKITSFTGPVLIGKDLQYPLSVNLITNGVALPVRVRSSAPDLVLVSTAVTKPGDVEAQSTYPYNFYAQALSGQGTATLTVSADGYADSQIQVQLAPSGFAWRQSAVAVGAYSSGATLQYAAYTLDPDSLAPVSPLALRAGVTVTPAATNANPEMGDLKPSTTGAAWVFTAGHPGSTTISLTQPPGFTVPSLRSNLRVVINPGTLRTNGPAFLGHDLQAPLTITGFNANPLTITSDDPSRLLLSPNATAPGTGALQLRPAANQQSYTVYLQALAADGTVNLRMTADGTQDFVFPVTLTRAVAVLNASTIPVQLTTYSPDYAVTVSLFDDTPLGVSSPNAVTLRPGADAVEVGISSTQPGVVKPLVSKVTFLPGATTSQQVQLRPLDTGDASIVLNPPPAFLGAPELRQATVTVTKPGFQPATLTVGRDQIAGFSPQITVSLPGAVLLTAVSSDPSRVQLSSSIDQPGSGKVVVSYGGNSYNSTLYLQGISAGTATITLSTAGFQDTQYQVTVTPPVLSLSNYPGTAYIGQNAQLDLSLNGSPVRPGAHLTVNLTSSDPTIATVDSPVTIDAGKYTASTFVHGLAPGKVTISADPTGFAASSVLSKSFTVSLPPLPLNIGNTFAIGNQLQGGLSFYQGTTAVYPLTVTSSDPSKVLLSTDAKLAAQPAVTFTSAPQYPPTVWIHGLAATGSATLTFSSPGYASTTVTVTLCGATFSFDRPLTNTNLKNPFDFYVQVRPELQTNLYNVAVRSTVPVPLVLSQPGVGSISPPTPLFNPGDTQARITFTPTTSGTTVLSITTPAGFLATTPPGQLVITVN